MAPPKTARPAPAVAGSEPRKADRAGKPINPTLLSEVGACAQGKVLADIEVVAQQKKNGGFRDANAERAKAASASLADKYIARDGGTPVADEVERLGELSDADYEIARKGAASALGVRVSALDKFVAASRAGSVEALGPEPPLWPEPVNGAELLDALTEVAAAHIVLPSGAAEAIALWTMFSHAHDCFGISPLLAITSPTPACGKTVTLDLLDGLVPRKLASCNITSAVLFRAVEKWSPTLLIDEADSFLRDNNELRGILDSGHRRSNAFVLRTVGDNHEPKQFTTWAPKAMALIGKLHPTLDSRSIHICLRRMMPTESVVPLRHDRREHLVPLKRRAMRWASDNSKRLRSADPEMPAVLHGRAADNWRPMLAIADAAGGEWPARAREVAEALAGRSEETIGVLLIEDIHRAFAGRQVDRIASKELCDALAEMEDRPWPEFKGGKPITQRQLARLLEPFSVVPGTIRPATGRTSRGYYREAFEDAFKRYLAPLTPFASDTPTQPFETENFSPDLSDTGPR